MRGEIKTAFRKYKYEEKCLRAYSVGVVAAKWHSREFETDDKFLDVVHL